MKKKKVNSLEELITKAKEFATSQGGTDKTRIIHSYANSGEYAITKNGPVRKTKGGVGIELKGKKGKTAEFFLEQDEIAKEKDKEGNPTLFPIPVTKILKELRKIGIDYEPNKKNRTNQSDQPEKHDYRTS